MAAEKVCFKDYIQCKDDKMLSKTRKKINRKRKDSSSKNVYGWAGYGPPPNISGAPAANGGAAAAGAAGGVGEGYQLAKPSNTKQIRNVYKYGKRGTKFLDFLRGKIGDEDEEKFDPDIDPVEPVGDDPHGEVEDIDDNEEDYAGDPDDPMFGHGGIHSDDPDVDYTDPDYEDEPEYADEVQVGDWTIRRIDDEDYDTQTSFDDEDYEYAEDAEEPSKKDQARALYRAMKSGEYSRKDIIGAFEKRLGLSPSSSTAYYERIAKEYGETTPPGGVDPSMTPGAGGMGIGDMGMMGQAGMMGQEEPEYQDPQEWEDPHRQGVIRTVDNAHLVFKRQTDDGSFEELWIYKQGEQFQDELDIRHDIIAGTDIPVSKTQSPDGSQKAEAWSIGDVQYLNITGLPN